MSRRVSQVFFAVIASIGLTLALAWLIVPRPVHADPDTGCVNQTGTGCDGACSTCEDTVQAALNAATSGDEIRIAGGTYYGPGAGTVAAITGKELLIRGGYDSSCGTHDPDTYETVLDAQWGGSVVSITNATDVTLLNLTLTRGDGTGNCTPVGGCGGGIYAMGTSLHVGSCVITDNVGSTAGSKGDGGGIYAYASGHSVEIWDSDVLSNVANTAPSANFYSYGGGIYIQHGAASLRENEVLSNTGSVTSTGGYGGGIFLYDVAPADLLTNTIRGNKASLGTWAGSGSGGGLSLFGGNAYLAGNRVENNWTNPDQAGYGGGVHIWSTAVAHLAGNTIISNATLPQGTGWWAPGGGVCIEGSESVTLSNNFIISNTASTEAGGGVYVAHSTSPALLVNNTIADNGNSGLVVGPYVALTLINNIVAGHTLGVTNTSPAISSVSADTNLFWNTSDPIVGTNAIQQDPLLLPDYHLDSGSPAINRGLSTWVATDIDGDARPDGCFFDIGADEFISGQGCRKVYLPVVVRNY